ncbi:hypothetical protein PRUPE_5G123700 [Prunus persica]|uniref:Cellulose synthase-like protein G3 n=1 Tax=Prunus persica TaxID=3760 RepID=A0A251P7D5_PRUPE|nr:hypothetical protein PRUPE_5G123700 [Prunus persica]
MIEQILLDNSKDKDITEQSMSNLIYVSREKRRTSPHHFKTGALNDLLRVSATMTNAPTILTLDCDTYSNDPQTPHHALCYLPDPKFRSKLEFLQFPQRFHGINKKDVYACEHKRLYKINSFGIRAIGTKLFRNMIRVFFGGPSHLLLPEMPQLGQNNVVDKPIQSQEVLELAHHVAGCNYEKNTTWGLKIGVRYGLLEVAFSKHSPITHGTLAMGPFMGLAYAQYAFWPIWSISFTIYAFLLQLAFLNGLTIFPKINKKCSIVSNPWFLLYVYLCIGAYGQDLLDFLLAGGTFHRWWNDQRMWMIRGLSSFLFGTIEFSLKSLGIASHGFNVTSKVLDEDQSKRYEQGSIEFGVSSPLFVTLTMAAIVNLVAFAWGNVELIRGSNRRRKPVTSK